MPVEFAANGYSLVNRWPGLCGIRHSYRTGFGEAHKNIKKAQIINFDLGIGDPITLGPQPKQTSSLFPDNEDVSWSVYPVETICAEMLPALISHGNENSRSKDVHHLAIFLQKADPKALKNAIKNCFEFRDTEIPKRFIEGVKQLNTSKPEGGWDSAMASTPGSMTSNEAFRLMLRAMADVEGNSD